MNAHKTDVVVMCGGKGTRFGQDIPQQYGSKSLIPVTDRTAVDYVFQTLAATSAVLGQIFLCIEREELRGRIEEKMQLRGLGNASVFVDQCIRMTMHTVYELKERYESDKILVLFGHQIITSRHLQDIISWGRRGRVVVSLYKTSSDNLRKITAIDHEHRCQYLVRGDESSQLNGDEYYGDVPYLLSLDFVRGLKDEAIRSVDAIKRWFDAGGDVYGRIAEFPHEFHYPYELAAVAQFAEKISEEGKR